VEGKGERQKASLNPACDHVSPGQESSIYFGIIGGLDFEGRRRKSAVLIA
jgi:hypothetical protein